MILYCIGYRNLKKLIFLIMNGRNIIELTVESGSAVDGKSVGSISWPMHTVLVDIKRGDKQILPDQAVRVASGRLYLSANGSYRCGRKR